ncbi:6-mannosyltransferase MNN10 (Bud emergence delay protein 1) (Mannan polymerase II complex MNN10 subunit) (M-Pol II subunit MNN10) [Durusdinium trenchii]|uniref:6-mannosyltransferase MNN10 (Bud emergence delay protein 1) (Mannan polymerase II complex MNN10 subunit) (M-Pol II subunit MNN10) n=1 Tax=Durusdinium trenchii TaxID=1381693 RepID=A0ABP0S3C9_9DINO
MQLQAHFFEAQYEYFSSRVDSKIDALVAGIEGLNMLMRNLDSAYLCPLLAAKNFKLVAEWATAASHPWRARCLLQLGNIFKLQAMARWYNQLPQSEPRETASKRFEPRLQVEYTIAVTQLHASLQTPLRPLVRWQGAQPRIQVQSICNYRPDPTSRTGAECPLPHLSVPNHRAYAERHGYKYVLHTELPLPDREAHYSKMLVIHQAFLSESPDWVFFIDCDAFFTDAQTSLADILATYGATELSGPHFLVAEDPGGINTGTLLVRRSDWSLQFLERVANSRFSVAWDQSMFFWEILNPSLLPKVPERAAVQTDYVWPPEVALVHQAHLNAFVPPASNDWSAHEWRKGDFIRHFAGCPWQESHCLDLMRETAAFAQQQ